ncbi:FG-GAP repeat protein [Hahella sp. SMD15-11]|uniref:FG-GAP repeat protein n=1 Tax=Thermohahella caldifontis TaxID=3142973 RepID=A0AB39UUJ2_9GAMM
MTWKNQGKYLLACTLVSALTACGGSGGGGDSGEVDSGGTNGDGGSVETTNPPQAPVLTLAPQAIKTFHFNWSDVSGATEYRLLENPDGASGFSQIATLAADATSHDHEVFLPARMNAQYMLQACNSAGCSDSGIASVSGTLAEAIGYFKASNLSAQDAFGSAIALSEDGYTLAVGAKLEDSGSTGVNGDQTDDSASGSGAVYVFVRNNDNWTQQAYIKASNSAAGDLFGSKLALSGDGNTLAVSAPLEDSGATGINGDQDDNSVRDAGAVYVFVRHGGSWSQQAYIKASNPDQDDFFGFSLALSGNGSTLAVGALFDDSAAAGINGDDSDNSLVDSGAAFVFIRDETGSWVQQAYIKAPDPGQDDLFGFSLALSGDGNTLAVGGPKRDSTYTGLGLVPDSGAAYIFVRDGAGTWSHQAQLEASYFGPNEFGTSLALSKDGETLAVGADSESSGATGINGDQTDRSAPNSGAVYVFTRSNDTWAQQAYIKASNTEAEDRFGQEVALSGDGNTLAVSAPEEDSSAIGIGGAQNDNSADKSGAVYVFTRNNTDWTQLAYIKAPNTDVEDQFGSDGLALSGDGQVLAIGTSREDSSANEIGGDSSDNSASGAGAVYLY